MPGRVMYDTHGKIVNFRFVRAKLADTPGVIYLSQEQMEALDTPTIEGCFVDVQEGVVKRRIPATIYLTTKRNSDLHTVATIKVKSKNVWVHTQLLVSGQDYGDAPVDCPATGVSLTFTTQTGGFVDIYDKKYVANSKRVYFSEE